MKTFKSRQQPHLNPNSSKPFISKRGESDFLSNSRESEKPFFSPQPVQTKLDVTPSDDKHESEADSVSKDVVQEKAEKKATAPKVMSVPQRSEGKDNEIMMSRDPDISFKGFDTFYVGTSDNEKAFAIQTGLESGASRVSLNISSQTSGLLNPPSSERKMSLPIHSQAARTPKIINETEIKTDSGAKEKFIELELSSDTSVPNLIFTVRYNKGRAQVPFPEGAFGVWKWANYEAGWINVTDGFRDLTVNFATEIPESFHSSQFKRWRHPGLGLGYMDKKTNTFYPEPMGQPTDKKDLIRTVIHLVPVVGPLVMLGEAIVGRDIWDRKISTLERAILGIGALLSVISPFIRGARTAASTLKAVNHVSKVGNVSRTTALKMVLGSRAITGPEKTKLAQYAAKIKAGQTLAQKELTAFNRILSKFEEPARVASVRAEVKAITGIGNQPGRFTDLAPQTSALETRAGKVLASDLKADVVRVGESTLPGRRVGDYLINDVPAELYTPRTSNIDNLIRGAVKKHQQSPTICIDVSMTTVPKDQLLNSTLRFFNRPEFADVNRLIFLNESKVLKDVMRTAGSTGVGANALKGAALRGAASKIGDETTD